MMKLLQNIFRATKGAKKTSVRQSRKDLERRATKGAEKAVKEYRRVFERLAEYDRAT